MSLFAELKRRNVFRVAIAYIIVAWLVMQIADVVLNNITAPGWVFQVLMLFLAVGFPFAVIFAWAFELTPEGLKRDFEVDRSQSITPHTGRKLNFAIIVLLVAALVFVVADNYVLDRSILDDAPAQRELVSIAVLPFVNMSNDAEQEYFSDGISEELLNLLAKIPEFQVAGRTSSFTFKGQNQDIPNIGQKLGVENILEGSVRKSADQVRITAQLVKASDGFHLWSETYDRTLDDIFAVQDDIAGKVVKALKIELLGGTENLSTTQFGIANGESYNAYLKGLYLYNKSGPDNLERAVGHMQDAVDLAPNSALAWAGLSQTLGGYAGQSTFDPTDLIARAQEAADKALTLDANLPDAHLAVADLNYAFYWDWAGAEAAANRVLALRPGDLDAQMILVDLHIAFGRLEEAERIVRAVLTKDPLNDRHPRKLLRILFYLHRYDEAMHTGELLLENDPNMPFVRAWMVATLIEQNRTSEALQYAQSEPVLFARLLSLAVTQHAMGNLDEAAAAQRQLLESYGDRAAAQQALIFVAWGELDTGIDWLETAYDNRDPGIIDIKTSPTFVKLQGHPRYEALLRKMNLAD